MASSLITLSLLIFSLSPLAAAQFITDTSGIPLVNGGSYSIKPNFPGPDEGTLSWVNKTKSCPLYVAQGLMPIEDPPAGVFRPPAFTSVTIRSRLKSLLIPVSATFDITFNDRKTPCKNRPLKWSIRPVRSLKNTFYLVAGYTNPHFNYGSFKVVNATDDFGSPNVYRLLYCFHPKYKRCLPVGHLTHFANHRLIFGITSNPSVKHFPTDLTFS